MRQLVVLMGAVLGIALATPVVNAGIVQEHSGANDPDGVEGWIRYVGSGVINYDEAVIDTAFDNTPAWKIADTVGGSSRNYYVNLSDSDLADADSLGWKLSALVRVDGTGYCDDDGNVDRFSMYLEFGGSPSVIGGRWAMRLGSDNSGNPLVDVLNQTETFAIDGNGYHWYELIDADGSGLATLYVDGTPLASGLAISDTYADSRVVFGDNHRDPAGNANYAYVGFETGSNLQPVPEPSAIVLLLTAGGLGLGAHRWRRGRRRDCGLRT